MTPLRLTALHTGLAGVRRVFSSLLGSTCFICGEWQTRPFCAVCLARHARPQPRCSTCAIPVPAGRSVCGACVASRAPFERALATFDYAYPWSERILALKHSRDAEGVEALAACLTQTVRTAYAVASPTRPPVDLLVPVPSTPERLQARGHNPAWELTRRVARDLDLPARADLIQRWPGTHPQQSLDRAARRLNIRGAFHAAGPKHACQGQRVALVDDVMTTGATLEELAQTLRRAGALEVHAWVLARAA